MSWDKYNEARKKAKEAAKALNELSEITGSSSKKSSSSKKTASSKSNTKKSTSAKSSKSSAPKKSSSTSSKKTDLSDINLSTMSKSDIKTAYKNAKTYRWLFVIFAILSTLLLCSLIFTSTIEPVVNSWFNTYTNKSAEDAGNGYVKTITDVTSNSKLKIHYVYVGQGDCILIDLPDGKNIIIDSGTDKYSSEISQRVIDYIQNFLLDDGEIIDYMILTHPDSDHMYYLPDILDHFEVATIYRPYVFYVSDNKDSTNKLDSDNTIATKEEKDAVVQKELATISELNSKGYEISWGDPSASKTNTKGTEIMYKFVSRAYNETYRGSNKCDIRFPIAGGKITGTGYVLTFYAPVEPGKLYSSWNDYSSVMVLEYNGTRVAFTGDAEKLEEKEILDNQNVLKIPDVDIMDMGHHGSRTSSQDAFIKALSPEYAIISCGVDNKYGHPHQKTLDTLHSNGVDDNRIFITAQSGDIVIGLTYTAPDTAESKNFIIAYSGEKGYVIPAPIYIEWWEVVVALIILSAIILLIIIPSCIKKIKRTVNKFKN